MSQDVFSTIDPNVTSGIQLAAILNNFKDAVMSGFIGPVRPDQLTAGGIWVDNSQGAAPNYRWRVKLYTGTIDITLFDVNTQSGSFAITGTENLFNIVKSSDDDTAALLRLTKRRIAGTGGLDAGDDLGAIQFYGRNSSMIDKEMATILAEAIEAITPTASGSALVFRATRTGEINPIEMARLVNGNFGVGIGQPAEALHASGNLRLDERTDNANGRTVKFRKIRASGNGQTLANDVLGRVDFNGTDQNGTEVLSARIETATVVNTTDAAQTTKTILQTKSGVSLIDTAIFEGRKTTIKDLKIDGVVTGSMSTPAVFVDVMPTPTTSVVRLTDTGLTQLTGITAVAEVREVVIINDTGNELLIKNQDVDADINGIITGTEDDIEIASGSVLSFIRDTQSNYWRIVGGAGGAGGGGKKVLGSMSAPIIIDSNEYTFTGSQATLLVFAQGDAAGEILLDTISAGKKVGQELHFYFTSATDLVNINDTGNIATRGEFLSDENSIIKFLWNGLQWAEIGRN